MSIKKILRILSTPQLFYKVGENNFVFRTFSIAEDTGALYTIPLTKQTVGKTLEYRMELGHKLNWVAFLTPIILYFMMLSKPFTFFRVLLFEFLWIGIVSSMRLYCSKKYSDYLVSHFGHYKLVEYMPPLSNEKITEYVMLFLKRVLTVFLILVMYFMPMFFLPQIIKWNLNSKHKNYALSAGLTSFCLALYPKTESMYDLKAFADFRNKKYEEALADYKIVLKMSGRRFTDKDYVRLANLMLIQKWISNSNDAVDVFNEFVTRKRLSTLQSAKVLWIRSMFEIENNIDYSIQHDYNDLLDSLKDNDLENRFYILSDKAYISYVAKNYQAAYDAYSSAINYAQQNAKQYEKDLRTLYVERGFTRLRLGDKAGARVDFDNSTFSNDEINQMEPRLTKQEFWIDKF